MLSAMCLAGADAFAPACTPGIAMRPGAALCHHRGSSMAGPTLRSPAVQERKRGLRLRMSSSETETSGQVSGADEAAKAAKMKEVMKIAEQARTALLEAEKAEDQVLIPSPSDSPQIRPSQGVVSIPPTPPPLARLARNPFSAVVHAQ